MSFIGINLGAMTVKVVRCGPAPDLPKYWPTMGVRWKFLRNCWHRRSSPMRNTLAYPDIWATSPSLPPFNALRQTGGDFDAVASLGGESFLVYTLTDGRVTNVFSHNKCAAGSGEFLVQLAARMGLDIDTAIGLSASGKVVPLASRCTVHCKSDVTHKLNRYEATPADILKTLHVSMAGKVVSLLEKGQTPLRRVLLIGGVTRNSALREALRKMLPSTELLVLPEGEWFEAWSSALLTRDIPLCKAPHLSQPPVFETLPEPSGPSPSEHARLRSGRALPLAMPGWQSRGGGSVRVPPFRSSPYCLHSQGRSPEEAPGIGFRGKLGQGNTGRPA